LEAVVSGRLPILILLALGLGLTSCGAKKTPNRDHIPVLKSRIFELQEAVKDKNRARIDSLLSVKIVSNQQGSDSLLAFVYGPSGDLGFERFGDRPIVFAWVYEHDLWLLKRFEAGEIPSDTI